MSWFVDKLTALGWKDDGGGWLSRDDDESFLIRVDQDRRHSRVAASISWPARRIQEQFEEAAYAGTPKNWSVLTLSYTVAAQT